MTIAAVSGELRGGTWRAGAPTHAQDGCASIPGFFGWVLEYVQPLQEWFDDLLGDPAAVSAFSADWNGISSSAVGLSGTVRGVRRSVAELDGRTVRALVQRCDDVLEILDDVQDWSGATAAALALASSIVTAVRETICGFLSLLSRLADAIVDDWWNPFSKIDQVNEIAEAASDLILTGQRLIETMFTALGRLITLIQKLVPLLEAGLRQLADLIGRMLPYAAFPLGGVIPGLLSMGLGDLLKLNPDVGELDPTDPKHPLDDKKQLPAYKDLMERVTINGPQDLIDNNRLIDLISGGEDTAISISTVTRDDGSVYYLVNLPSTLDWVNSTGGPMNDLDSNIALMVMDNPVLRTQYERAVLAAMADAGVPAGADVVWSGFSQGGIMSANLASDDSHRFNTVGVVTNGSPIDGFSIPSTVPVLQVEHANDPVAKLDLQTPLNLAPPTVGLPTPGAPLHPAVSLPPNVDWAVMPGAGPLDVLANHDARNYSDNFAAWYAEHGGTLRNDYAFLNGSVTDVYIAHTRE